jgi:hypothetical protein
MAAAGVINPSGAARHLPFQGRLRGGGGPLKISLMNKKYFVVQLKENILKRNHITTDPC